MPKDKQSALNLAAAGLIAVTALWVSCATWIFLVAMPLHSIDGGSSMVFDPTALVSAASIMVAVVTAPWVPVYLFAKTRSRPAAFALAFISAWVLLGSSFYFVDASGDSALIGRAAGVMANGQDMIFMPVVIPAVSVFSGAAYCLALWLLQRTTQRNASAYPGVAS